MEKLLNWNLGVKTDLFPEGQVLEYGDAHSGLHSRVRQRLYQSQ
jgi:hypothetical protein